MQKIKLQGDRVLVELDEEEKKYESIHIPEAFRDTSFFGTVLGIGGGMEKLKANGTYFKNKIKSICNIGDRVFVRWGKGVELSGKNKRFRIVKSDDIEAIIE